MLRPSRAAPATAVALTMLLVPLTVCIHQGLEAELRKDFVVRARSIAESAERVLDAESGPVPAAFRQRLCESLAELESVSHVELFDRDARVVAHSVVERVGEAPLPAHRAHVRAVLAGSDPVVVFARDAHAMLYFAPLAIRRPTGNDPARDAVVELVLDTREADAELTAMLRSWIAAFTLATLALTAAAAFASHRIGRAERGRRAAQQTAARLGLAVENSLHEVFVFTADTLRFVQVNPTACARLGTTEAALLRLHADDVLEADRPALTRRFAPLLEGRVDHVRFRGRHRRRDGSTYPVEALVVRTEVEGRPALMALALDITRTLQEEKEQAHAQKMQVIGQLAAGIAHDFNNLLTTIQVTTDLMKLDASAPREHLEQICSTVAHAGVLTRRLLAFGRKSGVEPVRLDVADALEDLLPTLRRLIPENVQIEVLGSGRRSAEAPLVCALEEGTFEQIVVNLATNARDAMPHGGRLRLHASHTTSEGTSFVRICVEDDGDGIRPEHLDRVFEPFFTTKAPGTGTGMGLATVAHLVRDAGGRVDLESSPGFGTRIHVDLPLLQVEHGPRQARDPVTDEAGIEGLDIVVCEDDPAVLGMVTRILETVGAHVRPAATCRIALDRLQGPDGPDVLLTDVMVSDASGYDLARIAREQRADLGIVLMTGYTLDRDQVRVLAARAVEKPLDRRSLLAAVRAAAAERVAATS